jgi:hypothetical protein
MKSHAKLERASESERPMPSPMLKDRRERSERVKVIAWLRCRLDPGMFSDEVVVTYPAPGRGEWQTTVFVPNSSVRSESEHDGEVMVEVVFQHGVRCAMLPNDEQHIVKAEDGDLRQP